ncbi:MAG: hypothetical protein K1X72_03675 [Pyrinomonadaceae bacterium]|nr:hypothetical protein [Pyrinomonadaceae bacterium]
MKPTVFLVKFFVIFCFAFCAFYFNANVVSSQNPTDIDCFKGNWTVKLRNNPNQSFSWKVSEDLNQSWLHGVVEQNGNKISTDFWRQNGKKIERFAFTGNSVFVKIESEGWEADKLILKGSMSDKSGENKIRETITKVSEREFNALWEMENSEGKWIVFGDEICTK